MDSNGRGYCSRSRKAASVKISKNSHIITKSTSGSSSSSNSMNDSPKARRSPLIRVVHIFNPTVIKTDAANFRSLVQSLTGKNFKPRTSCRSKESSLVETTPPTCSPAGFEAQFPREFPGDPFLSAPFFDAIAADGKAQLFDLGEDNSLGAADAMKMPTPERMGIFGELDIATGLGSSDPLADCSILPSLIGSIDPDMRSPVHRLASFYNSFEAF